MSTNGLGYAEAQVDYYVDDTLAARRTFDLGHNTALNRTGKLFFEGIANAFDIFPPFQAQGIARTLHKQLTRTLRAAGVDRILVKADRDGSAVWQRYYEWDFEEIGLNSQYVRAALFDAHTNQPLSPTLQKEWRVRAVRSARWRARGIPFWLRASPAVLWRHRYAEQALAARHLVATHTIRDLASAEGNEATVSALLSSTNWHGVLCLSDAATAHNEQLRLDALAPPKKRP